MIELVEGPTLADRIAQGPLPVDEALAIARQIADALEAAHAQGIVHRDLKPANVKLRPDGIVKVLDFGLAKLADAGAATASTRPACRCCRRWRRPWSRRRVSSSAPSAYMSPEQARGKPVDERTDIWSFGCVLYEMLTGLRAVPGRRQQLGRDCGHSHARAVWAAVPPGTPESVRRLLRRCLQKDSTRRLRDAGDARLEIR